MPSFFVARCRRFRSSLVLALAAWLVAGHAFAQSIDTYAGGGTQTADGTHRTALRLTDPHAILAHGDDLYVAESGRIRRIAADGVATTIAGTGVIGYSGDGGPATAAQVGRVSGMAIAPDGSLWFADALNLRVRRVGSDGIVDTVAGNGSQPDAIANGPATEIPLADVRGVAFDSQGRAYIASPKRVRRLEADGTLQVVAGQPPGCMGFILDGDSSWAACFREVAAIAVEGDELFILEGLEDRVWRVDHKQHLRFVARNRLADGVTYGVAGQMSGFAFDPWFQTYVSSIQNPRVHRFDTPVAPAPVAGNGTAGFSGDGGAATTAKLDEPHAVAVAHGNLYIADSGNHRIRRVPLPTRPEPTRPPPPRVIAGSQEAYLTIIPPANAGDGPITGYTLEATEYGSGVVTVADADAGTLELNRIVTGLNLGGTYFFRVVAHNAHGASKPSAYTAGVRPDQQIAPTIPARLETIEGDAGLKDVVVTITIPIALPRDIVWNVSLRDTAGVEPGVDYEADSPLRMTIPAGETSGSYTVRVRGDTAVEFDEMLRMNHSIVSGPRVYLYTHTDLHILNDDEPPPDPVVPKLVDDRYALLENAPARALAVLANDGLDPALLVSAMTVSTAPTLGVVVVAGGGTADLADDKLRYTPMADRSGVDTFAYRVCYPEGCRDAKVTVVLNPIGDLTHTVDARTGSVAIPQVSTRARDGATWNATPLVAPRIAFNDYNSFYIDVPPGDPRREWRLLVDATGAADSADFDLIVSVDADGDLWDDPEEVRCRAAMRARHQRCEVPVQVDASGLIRYWVRVARRNAVNVLTDVFEVPMVAGDGTLAATAPSILDRDEAFSLRLGWDDSSVYDGALRAGYVRVRENGQPAGDVPVRLQFAEPALTPLPLVPGTMRLVAIPQGATDSRIFVDIPAGATSLKIVAKNADAHDIHLVKADAQDPALSTVAAAPAVPAALSMLGAQMSKTLELTAPTLTPGRWYVVVHARAYGEPGARTMLSLTATIEGAAPTVRPGSYFNAGRPGHGLLLYPAADQWAGLWYTYFADGTPTWYYLQAPAPSLTGVWTSKLYRSTWQGTGNHLAPVGHATLTPSGPDAFQFSYLIDGVAGSEPLAALGRGCPKPGGTPVDASSHWFDPARAGSGYSVQLWPDYEFHAAFVYDDHGVARFLTAESPNFAGADATLVLEQLQGFCPTCAASTPTRQAVGTIRRLFGAGGLTGMQVDAMFDTPLAGDWIVDDKVVPLGGPGTTQGCEL